MEEMLMNVANAGRLSPESYQDLIQDRDDIPTSSKRGSGKKRALDNKRQKAVSAILSPSSLSSCTNPTTVEENNNDVTHKDSTSICNANNPSSSSSGSSSNTYSYVGSSSGLHLLGKLFPKSGFPSHSNILSSVDESDMMVQREPENAQYGTIVINEKNDKWEPPHKEVLDRLIELYFKKMNVFIPIVDETDFYETYRKGEDNISKPLILAICRASARLLDEDDWVVKKHNINRNELFVSLSDELLCEQLDFMNPTIDKIQILLLTACTARKWAAESTDWLAISLGVKMAQDLGLHRSNTQLGIPTQKIEARKRLWWSAYVLDRWICATLGRPLTISDADCDVELPKALESSNNTNNYLFIRYFTTLSAILGDVLRILCSPRARSFSDKRRGMEEIYRSLNKTLEDWDHSLPDQWKFSSAEMERIERKDLNMDLENKLNYGVGQLRLAYYSVLLLLKRPFVATGERSEFEVPDECYDAIQSILNIVEAVQIKSMLSFSWSLTSYIMFQVLIVTLLLLRNRDQEIATNAENCVERLSNQYRRVETYIPEPSAIPVLEIMARLVKDPNEQKNNSDDNHTDEKVALPSSLSNDNTYNNDISSTVESSLSSADENTRAKEHQYGMPVWGASSGLDWQDLMDILADSGYQALKGK
ncbi:fungal-specific transcription factor domain-containing protein [Circinella umbellata]|nr:fungal-specific transcription factor domain-containing protein [Circinella umbellata]